MKRNVYVGSEHEKFQQNPIILYVYKLSQGFGANTHPQTSKNENPQRMKKKHPQAYTKGAKVLTFIEIGPFLTSLGGAAEC